MKKYKTRNAKIGAKALKRYHRKQKIKKIIKEKPDIVYWLFCLGAMLSGIAGFVTNSSLVFLSLFIMIAITTLWTIIKGL